jgi:hypothetical protein
MKEKHEKSKSLGKKNIISVLILKKLPFLRESFEIKREKYFINRLWLLGSDDAIGGKVRV